MALRCEPGTNSMGISIRKDDLSSREVRALIDEHLSDMHRHSPPDHVHALAIESLRAPSITFWTAWDSGELCGCGALKHLNAVAGEIKSMRTRSGFLRRGVGQAILQVITDTAVRRGYSGLFLETGSGPAFESAHAFYRRNGFELSEPFADYRASDFSVFLVKRLPDPGAA